MAFNDWKLEKAVQALVDEAQAMADRLSSAKPHQRDALAATTRYWHSFHLAQGQDLPRLSLWPAADRARLIRALQTRIAALRKARDYDSADGLAVWLHTARACDQSRIAPALAELWGHLLAAGPNADSMADDLLAGAGLAPAPFAAPLGVTPPD